MALVNINRTHLRCQNQMIVIGNIISGRTQAVAVQNGAKQIAIAEYDGSRSVPRFHHSCIVMVEILHFLRHGLVMGPWSRKHDHDCQWKIHTAHHHKFQSVV